MMSAMKMTAAVAVCHSAKSVMGDRRGLQQGFCLQEHRVNPSQNHGATGKTGKYANRYASSGRSVDLVRRLREEFMPTQKFLIKSGRDRIDRARKASRMRNSSKLRNRELDFGGLDCGRSSTKLRNRNRKHDRKLDRKLDFGGLKLKPVGRNHQKPVISGFETTDSKRDIITSVRKLRLGQRTGQRTERARRTKVLPKLSKVTVRARDVDGGDGVVTKGDVNRLREIKEKNDHDDKGNLVCITCMETDCLMKENAVLLPCHHVVCKATEKWMDEKRAQWGDNGYSKKKKPQCPKCRCESYANQRIPWQAFLRKVQKFEKQQDPSSDPSKLGRALVETLLIRDKKTGRLQEGRVFKKLRKINFHNGTAKDVFYRNGKKILSLYFGKGGKGNRR